MLTMRLPIRRQRANEVARDPISPRYRTPFIKKHNQKGQDDMSVVSGSPTRIISLSTIPSRFPLIRKTLDCLLAQSARVDEIWLVIPRHYRRFPDYDGSLPDVPKGIRVVQTDEDLGPATKILAAAEMLRGEDCSILFCDDDQRYHRTWAEALFAAHDPARRRAVAMFGIMVKRVLGKDTPRTYRNPYGAPPRRTISLLDMRYRFERMKQQVRHRQLYPRVAKPHRVHFARGGYVDLLHGFGGVVVRPDYFTEADKTIPDHIRPVDDIWLSGVLAVRDIPIYVPSGIVRPSHHAADNTDPLSQTVSHGLDRDEANIEGIKYFQDTYNIWK